MAVVALDLNHSLRRMRFTYLKQKANCKLQLAFCRYDIPYVDHSSYQVLQSKSTSKDADLRPVLLYPQSNASTETQGGWFVSNSTTKKKGPHKCEPFFLAPQELDNQNSKAILVRKNDSSALPQVLRSKTHRSSQLRVTRNKIRLPKRKVIGSYLTVSKIRESRIFLLSLIWLLKLDSNQRPCG